MIARPSGRVPAFALALGVFSAFPVALAAQSAAPTADHVVRHHAAWCADLYGRVETAARVLRDRVEALVERPDAETLAAARNAWLEARKLYGMTEALRFHDGPIEPLEPLLNAWPVDEAYIDSVEGRPGCGMIHDPAGFPSLGKAILELANERGGEANICVGWHAIEFVLWGQDLSAEGPGDRPASDFVEGVGVNARRRCDYLRATTELLLDHLCQLRRAWAPGASYRVRFEKETDASVRRMLVGVTMLTAFELGGERLTVAFDTRDQEQEHSCFSDNSWQDLVSNQEGICAIVLGCDVGGRRGPGLVDLLRPDHPDIAADLEASLEATATALRAIPPPFDQAFLGDDDSEGRMAIQRAIDCLDQQTEALLIVGSVFGYDLPLAPGG